MDEQALEKLKALEGRISDLERLEHLTEGPWPDYSATSTITGWSSFTYKEILYKKIGKLVFVSFNLNGTSDSISVTFTLPYSKNTLPTVINFMIRLADNGVVLATPGYGTLVTNTVTCYKDLASTIWTNSGNKIVIGQFCYQEA